jgi:membrane carboxypeptidase/penicillin-binding protein
MARKDLVLRRMKEEGLLPPNNKKKPKKRNKNFKKQSKNSGLHFVEYVKEQVEEMYGKDSFKPRD